MFMIITYPWPVASANVELTRAAVARFRRERHPGSRRTIDQRAAPRAGNRLDRRGAAAVPVVPLPHRCQRRLAPITPHHLRIHSHQDRTKKMRKIAGRNDETSSRITRIVVDFPARWAQ